MQYILQIIKALPPCEGADVEALTEKLARCIEGIKSAQDQLAKVPNAKAVERQSKKVVTAVASLTAALAGLHEVTRGFIWDDISAEVDDLGRYVTPDEIKALLAPLRKSAQRVADSDAPSGNRDRFTIHIFTSVLVGLFEEATGQRANSDSCGGLINFLNKAFGEAGLNADPKHYLDKYCTRHPGA